ncbi:transcriptional regulator [Nocardia sp. 348MFTsu5.1]|uniref:transcriptional regulator n=1 Tax=Nocardia sp. 348MFTsu5.1 TaxID=1172185 RepID=UPI000380699B|nr:transcriptional regulator [Nocardia sp. 348MFTsu5.1]
MIDGLDPLIHAPKRLAAMAILANSTTASFKFLKEHLNLQDSDLSKQMSALESAGYLTASKAGHGRGGSTTFRITAAGKRAYGAHRSALQALLDGAPEPDDVALLRRKAQVDPTKTAHHRGI